MYLIIPDKFRGTMTAAEAAQAMVAALPQGSEYAIRPMADGGEGTADALPDRCVVECAAYIGHRCDADRHMCVLDRSSESFGHELYRRLRATGETVYAALGGSFTADGGAGLLHAFGSRFLDAAGNVLRPTPRDLVNLVRVDMSGFDPEGLLHRCVVLSDVRATLYSGPMSAMNFIAAKGATEADRPVILEALKRLQGCLCRESEFDGAAGGLGYALCGVAGCRGYAGADYILRRLDVDWKRVDMVFTGEGSIDDQSLSGKVVGTVLDFCRSRGIACVAFGGVVSPAISRADCIAVSPHGCELPSPAEARRRLTLAVGRFIASH